MDIKESLQEADRALLYLINNKLSFPSLDTIMLLLRQPYTWVPLYLFFLLFFYYNCRKYLLPIVILSLLTFAITDFTSASLLKPYFARLRPCQDPALQSTLNNPAACGGRFGMPSTHASNHFGLAGFWFMIIKLSMGKTWLWLWVWAFLICYAQVYVGVHYPGDVLIGAFLGVATAYLTFFLYRQWTDEAETSLKSGR